MRATLILAAMLSACAPVSAPPREAVAGPAADEGGARLRQAGAEVLFWNQGQRDRNFQRMDRLFPGRTVAASDNPRHFPRGTPLGLAGIDSYMADNNVAGLMVVQDGFVRVERYARGFTAQERWTSFSMAKSLTSTLVGVAIGAGAIRSLDDDIVAYLPELAGSGYDGVTIRQLLTMTSGVRWNENYADPNSDVARMLTVPVPPGEDQVLAYMQRLPRADPPGARWRYNTGETNLVGVLVRRATGKSLATLASEAIWRPYGMAAPLFWQTGVDGHEIGGCCISATLGDYARFGQFVLDGGATRGPRAVPVGWFAEATRSQVGIGAEGRGYGFQWWTEPGVYSANGIFGQTLFIDPARRLVIVQVAAWPSATDPTLSAARRAFIERIRAAASERTPPRHRRD